MDLALMNFSAHSAGSLPKLQPIIIVGASARAAAQWAISRGHLPWCIDLFGDRDLRAIANVTVCSMDKYPEGILDCFSKAPPDAPVILTGRMENHLSIVEAIARHRRLLHSSLGAMRAARQPALWRKALIPAIAGIASPQPTGATGEKLVSKPVASGSINMHNGGQVGEDRYLQRYVQGESISAVYEDDRCMGASKQLVEQFRYAGSIGPITTTKPMRELGQRLADRLGLRGLWGVDMVRDHDGVLVPVEINPRYCASMETVRTGRNKLVIYAKQDVTVGDLYEHFTSSEVADVPAINTQIKAGQPVCTLLASEADPDTAIGRLQGMADRLYTRLH